MAQNLQQNQGKSSKDLNDQIQIIEEKISKVNGDIAIKRYQKGKMLGKGGFAKCYEVTSLENKKILAAKIIPKSTLTKSRARQKLISEIKIHKALHFTNVVQFEHVFEDHENVYILLELCTNQTMNELLKRRKRLTELEVQCYLIQMLNSLKYLHSNRVIHRDMKLGNLFLSDKMEIKVGDFGLATKLEFDGEKKRTICGTPNYIAPEILDGKQGHSYEVDVWSLGVIIYTLLIGKPPFETPDVKTTYKKIRSNSYSFPDHVPISDQARNLITKILVLEPSKRPTVNEIFKHDFLNSGTPIPKLMPIATIACPPNSTYLKQYQSQENLNLNKQQSKQSFNQQTNNFSSKFQSVQSNMRPSTSENFKNFQTTKNIASNVQTVAQFNPMSDGGKNIRSEIWVKKYVDYSSKYGLGYLLSNGSTGVFFNDSTKIVLQSKGQYFEYMEKRASDKQDIVSSYTFQDYPKEIQKKVTLLQHFRNYLEGDQQQNEQNLETEEADVEKNQPLIYVKKWMKTRHAILFRLSNKIVQVIFTDKTEVILSSEYKMLTYVNKKRERFNYPLAHALESSNVEMTKRLKYTKEILAHMLNNPNNEKNAQAIDNQNQLSANPKN